LESPELWHPEKYADQDMSMKSAMIGDDESVMSQAAVVTPVLCRPLHVTAMNNRPGAYAVMQGRSMQHRQDDAGTITAKVSPTTIASTEIPPIAAEVVEDTQLDISSHTRRILAENAVAAKSEVALDKGNELTDCGNRRDSVNVIEKSLVI
jgi:hypothetical protein